MQGRSARDGDGRLMAASTRIEWYDLMEVPFERMNCWAQAREVARRAGLFLPEVVGGDRDDHGAELSPALEYVGPSPSCATRVGDLIVGDPEGLGWPSHVATLVDEVRGWAITTTVKHGPFAWPRGRHSCQHGVWRPKARLA